MATNPRTPRFTPRPAPAAAPAPPRRAMRRPVVEEHSGAAHISSEIREGRATISEDSRSMALTAVRFGVGEEPAFVRISHGKTINTGDFNSLRIDVSVTLPCLPEDVEAAAMEASNFVVEKLAEEELFLLGSHAPRRTANRRG